MAPETLVPVVSPLDRLALAAITVVLFLAGVGGLLTLPQHDGHGRVMSADAAAASALAPLPRTRGDRVLQHFSDAGFLGVVLDRRQRSVLHVVVARGARVVDCDVLRPQVRVRTQDATTVRLVVSGFQYVPRSAARAGTGGTTCVTAGSRAITVRLRAPLGERRVYDGGQAESSTVADPADFPAPRALPAGYTAGRSAPVLPVLGRLVAVRRYAKGGNRLVIRIGSRYDVVAPGRQTRQTTVEDSYAVVTRRSRERCVTWNELSGRERQVCSTGNHPLTGPALLVVARSLN